jgi:hypothetical protein
MIIALAFVIADLLTKSSMIEGIAFLVVVMGFILTAIPRRLQLKDERYQMVRAHSGYMAFMMMIIVISIVMMCIRYFDFEIKTDVVLRYLMMSMYFIYSAIYAIVKRVI